MTIRILGRTGVAVSRVALGCGTFGGIGSPRRLIGRGLNHDASLACMDEAVALGINLFDTAHSYADGAGERCIGEWLRSQTAEVRDGMHIATKLGNIVSDTAVSVDLSPRTIVEQLAVSLTRLGISHVDFCLSHAPDPVTPIESTLEGFADAIGRGWVSHIGARPVRWRWPGLSVIRRSRRRSAALRAMRNISRFAREALSIELDESERTKIGACFQAS